MSCEGGMKIFKFKQFNMSSIIKVKNLTKKYKNFTAVNNISFEVESGEVFAFLGPNGAGKTTTIKMLTTLTHPTKGGIFIDGYDTQIQSHEVRQCFGIVFQDPSLDDELTAYENMYFHAVLYNVPAKQRKKRIQELLEFVELADRQKNLVKTFSGGMKRRLEIARGFLHQPKIIFLDEPTLGLDPQTRNHIWEYIRKLNKEKGITIFFTTHYMAEAEKVADKIAIIDHGEIISQGDLGSLKDKTGTDNLEDAFLKLTGKKIREESATPMDTLRRRGRLWGRR